MADVKWTSAMTKMLIANVEKFECLYNDKLDIFKNRDARNEAQQKITEELKVICPTITSKHVQRKWSALMQCFREEQKKVDASKKSGAESDDVYCPTVYWWPLMQFLTPKVLSPDESIDNLDNTYHEAGPSTPDVSVSTPDVPVVKKKRKVNDDVMTTDSMLAEGLKLLQQTQTSAGPYGTFATYIDECLTNISKVDKKIANKCKRKITQLVHDAEEEAEDYNYQSLSQDN